MGSATKIVFLIDTSSDIDTPDIVAQRAHSICLSCLRLLLFSSSKAEKAGSTKKSKISLTNVKWGYKFFSSKSVKTKIEVHRFYDFKLKYFDEFENEVQRRFDAAPVTSSVKSSVCLSKALTELLSDFPWEGPDISSPVKGRKTSKQLMNRRNFVYLFSNCPKTSSQLKLFSGKKVPDADVFLDSFLPPSLFTEICYTSKLSINWIDTGGLPRKFNAQAVDVVSVHIVESAVSKVGGHVFPLDGLVQNGSPYFLDVQSLMIDGSEPENKEIAQFSKQTVHNHPFILPLSTTLEHLESSPNDRTVSGFDTVLKIGGVEICLEMSPSAKNTVNSRFHEPLEDAVDLTSISKSDVDMTNEYLPSSLKAYSILEKPSSSQMLLPEKCYLSSEAEKNQKRKTGSSINMTGLFRRLLSSLATRSCSLVLVCEDTGQLAVLEPFTVHTACIYILSNGTSLSIEKVLIQQVDGLKDSHQGTLAGDHLVEKLLAGKKFIPQTVYSEPPVCEAGKMDGKLMDRWHIPGPKSSFRSLIQKLNLRIKALEFLTTDETNVLKQLQKAYKHEKKPPGVRDTPSTSTNNEKEEKNPDERFELPFIGKKSRTSISRAEMILCKSKEVVKVRDNCEKDGAEKNKNKQGRGKLDVAAQFADFKNVEELKEFLTCTYEKVVSGESTFIDVNVQTTVTVTLHYLKQTEMDNPEEECHKVLSDCLLLSAGTLREKYSTETDTSTEQKIAEYQFQIVLRMEMLSTLINKDQTIGEEETNDEVVGMLRTLSFMCEAGALSKFMESCLLYNYMHTIPKTLANIYDELMQPLPDALSNIVSPNNSSADQSVFDGSLMSVEGGPPSARTRSHGSVGPFSNQPGSNKSFNLDTSINRVRGGRKLVHHPSLADFGAKRQIVVEKVAKQKEKSSRKGRQSGKKEKDKVAKSLFGESRGTKLERRQSVAVMQRTQKTPKKAQAKLNFKSPVTNNSRQWRKSLVAETPQHKQLSRSLIQHEDVVDESADTDVVEESPEKACRGDRKDTPTKGKRAKALMRRSFYSAGPIKRTRNLTQYFQLADRIAGRQRHPSNQTQNKLPRLLSLEADKQFKSPEKNSSFLMSQIVYSPSPLKCTPKKLNKTPSKFLLDSPSRNTRSRNQSGTGGLANLFGSPTQKASLQQKVASPSVRLLQSPQSRRQSPRVLVQESTTKNEDTVINKTPEKSPICGAISSGLDSPSQNTRQKINATPTRRSVRAALFSKSPAPNWTSSPRTAYASPRTLLSKFGSPKKQVTSDTLLSPKRQLPDFVVNSRTNQSSGNTAGQVHQHQSTICREIFRMDSNISGGSALKSNSENVQKTPSPHSKKAAVTPDSFDKWHRRKPRNQVSPAHPKIVNNTVCLQTKDLSSPIKPSLISTLDAQSPLRKKRNLILSPDRPVESPSKRRRTSRLDSLSSLGKGLGMNSTLIRDGSQGFDVNSPLQLSQMSGASSLDYFSTANDDIFLSQSQSKSLVQSPRKLESMEVDPVANNPLLTGKGSSIFKNRTLERICSSDLPCSGESARSESPIFLNSAINSTKSRHISGDRFIPNIENIKVDSNFSPVNSGSNSPNLGKSPGEKKYSPNVSAKSLMHLMNSPLVNGVDKNESRSRRSLRLQN